MVSIPQPSSTDQNRDGTIVPQEQAEGDQITLLKSPLSKSLEDTFTVREEGTSNGRNMRHSKAKSDERALVSATQFYNFPVAATKPTRRARFVSSVARVVSSYL